MRSELVIHTANRIIHIVLFVAKNVRKSILTDTVQSLAVMDVPKQEAHGKLKIVFKGE